jgi:hypothetical protein
MNENYLKKKNYILQCLVTSNSVYCIKLSAIYIPQGVDFKFWLHQVSEGDLDKTSVW